MYYRERETYKYNNSNTLCLVLHITNNEIRKKGVYVVLQTTPIQINAKHRKALALHTHTHTNNNHISSRSYK